MEYTIRHLNGGDILPAVQIINKIGFKEFKAVFSSKEMKTILSGSGSLEEIGAPIAFDIIGIIIGNLPVCDNDIFSLIGSLAGMTAEDVRKLELLELYDLLAAIKDDPGLKDFMKVVSKLLK